MSTVTSSSWDLERAPQILVALVLRHQKRILPWITGLDRVDRADGTGGDEDKWTAFLTDHPELIDR
jgi:hypothetical protein